MDFTLIPISKDSAEWQCSLLKFGGATVLLNCGWSESLDVDLLAPLVPHLGDLDLIVLTHADIRHLGALPYLLTKYPHVTCPVIATEPVCRLGELSCAASLEDRDKYREPVEDLEVDDVLRVFMSRVRPVSYRETFHAHARGRMLAACPHPAGMQLGSAYWVLQSGGHSICYLVDCSLRRSRYLDGLELQRLFPQCRGAAQRWDVLITAPPPLAASALPWRGDLQSPRELSIASKAMKVARNIREQLLLEETVTTLRRGGSVLIPADTVAVPELLLLLEAAWAQDRQLATSYPLVWLSSLGDVVLDQVKTRLEYMGREVLGAFERRLGSNPFVFRNVKVFQTLEELCAAHPLSRPKVVLTTSPHLEGGDSRELLLRLCSEPRTLLWLLGVPPRGTLAHQLLEDFVLRQCSRKDYRLRQHLKQALPDDQLRAYYEARLQELAESSQRFPLLPPELLPAKQEEPGAAGPEGGPGTGGGAKAAPRASEALRLAKDKATAGALWSPLGWPTSRTLTHSEQRSEGDEYGHRLTPAELRAWRAQDQEADSYGTGNPATEGAEAEVVKEEAVKLEKVDEDGLLPGLGPSADWRDSLRVHFREPMHFEVRERTARLACRVRFLPDGSLEPQDLSTIIGLMAPKHVVLLPTASEAGAAAVVAKHVSARRRTESAAATEVHILSAQDSPLQLSLRGLKRKAQFSPDVWPKLSFLKTVDGVRMARVHATTGLPHEAADARVVELGCCPADVPEGTEAAEGEAQPPAPGPLPRHGALFVGLSPERLSLSGLKEQLRAAEWAKSDVQIEFGPPGGHAARPWSSRVLSAGGTARLGWAGGGLRDGRAAAAVEGPGRAAGAVAEDAGAPVLRLEGLPGEEFFLARAALYRRCALL